MSLLQKMGARTHSAALSVVPILAVTFAVIGLMSYLAQDAYNKNEKSALLMEQRRIDMALDQEAW